MASSVAAPWHGTLALAADGLLTYTPLAGFTGQDTFTYRVTDGNSFSPLAEVTIEVSPTAQPAALQKLPGDVDGDRDVDQADMRLTLKLVGERLGTPRYVASVDLNADGRITISDAVAVRNLVGVISSSTTAEVLPISAPSEASLAPRRPRLASRSADARLILLNHSAVDEAISEPVATYRQLSAIRQRRDR